MLVISLAKVGDRVVRGHPAIPAGIYALEQMGKRTGAFEAVFSNDIDMFRPDKIEQFDAICFNNTQGVLFDDPELRKALQNFVTGGAASWASTRSSRPSSSIPYTTSGRGSAAWWAAPKTAAIHGCRPTPTPFKVDDPKSPLNAAFHGKGFEINDEVMQLQEPGLRERMHVLSQHRYGEVETNAQPAAGPRADKDFPLTWIRTEGKAASSFSGIGPQCERLLECRAAAALPRGHPIRARRSGGRRHAQRQTK